MRKLLIVFFSLMLPLILFNCGGDTIYDELDKIYIALEDDTSDIDSLSIRFDKIDVNDVKSEHSSALYNYIDCFLRYKREEKSDNDSLLDSSIAYYSKSNSKLLAASYLLKGEILYDRGRKEEAILSLKQCERLVEQYGYTPLKYRLYGFVGMVNELDDEYEIALEYSRKNLALSQKNRNYKWLADAYNSMAVGYYGIGMPDSARYYIRKCIPLLDSVTEKEKVIILNNLSFFHIEDDLEYSVECLEKAMSLKPDVHTYSNLAYIYAHTGKSHKADSLWSEALKTAHSEVKAKILENLIIFRKKQGKTDVADSLTKVLLKLKDTQIAEARSRRIRELQIGFDYKMERQRLETQKIWLFVALLTIVLIAVSVMYRYKYRSLQIRNELLERNRQIRLCEETIHNLELDGEAYKRQIEGQSQTLNTIRQQQEAAIDHGRRLFLEIKANKTTAMWSKNDFITFTDYYATVDAMFTLRLNTGYHNLSPRYKTFLILENEGFDIHEIARILSVSPSSLRTIRHRVNAARIK